MTQVEPRHLEQDIPWMENLIFKHRLAFFITFCLVTIVLAYNATLVRPEASFTRLIPLNHEYIQNYLNNRDFLKGANTISVAVGVKDGTILDEQYMLALEEIYKEVSFLEGVDRGAVESLWAPSVRWLEVTEEGFDGGPVIPSGYDGSQSYLELLRQNIIKSGRVGSLVANNFESSMVTAPLLEVSADGRPLDYQLLGQQLEELVRDKYQAKYPNLDIHIVGFAKKVSDLIDGVAQIAIFFLVALVITAILLYTYSRCPKSTVAPMVCSIVAVVWQLGLLYVFGYGLDPYSVLVPFLVLAIGISHGVQIINGIAQECAQGTDSYWAARRTFRRLYIPGMLALVSDAIGFLTLLFIDIKVIQDLAVAASIGVAVIIVTNLVLLPIIMSYVGTSQTAIERAKRVNRNDSKIWRTVAHSCSAKVAPISLAIAAVGLGLGLYYAQNLKIGDLDKGAPELRPESRYNQDNDYVTGNYSTSADVMVIMVRTPKEKCGEYSVIDRIDRFHWQLENIPGVQSVVSLATAIRRGTTAMNEGNFGWSNITRNQRTLNDIVGNAPSAVVNRSCNFSPIIAFLEDHKADTLERVVDAASSYAKDYSNEQVEFLLAAGNSGIEAATNEEIKRAQDQMLIFVYAVVSLLCLLTFRSIRAVICIIVPLMLTSVLCQALMAFLDIGVKVATLPVIALGVGIGVDYGIYIYSRLEYFLKQGKALEDAFIATLNSTGRAVSFTGLTLAIGVATWIIAPIKFQADMGILLTFMFLWNMIGALWLLPALAYFLINPEKSKITSESSPAKAS